MEAQTKIGIGAAAGIALVSLLEPHLYAWSPAVTIIVYVGLVGLLGWGFSPIAVAAVKRVEQSYFLLIAVVAGAVMVAALAGAWWKSGAQQENPIVPQPPAPPPTRPMPHYSADEKEKLGIAIRELSDILNKKGAETVKLAQNFDRGAGLSFPPITRGDFKFEKISLINKLNEISRGADDTYNAIYKSLIPGHFYADELTAMVGSGNISGNPENNPPLYVLSQAALGYIGDINAVAEIAKTDDLEKAMGMFHLRHRLMMQAAASVNTWIKQSNDRINQEKRELREAK